MSFWSLKIALDIIYSESDGVFRTKYLGYLSRTRRDDRELEKFWAEKCLAQIRLIITGSFIADQADMHLSLSPLRQRGLCFNSLIIERLAIFFRIKIRIDSLFNFKIFLLNKLFEYKEIWKKLKSSWIFMHTISMQKMLVLQRSRSK